ncbi:hypothetical protein [Bradyrhizobium sp. ERR14]|uniref:hypothetical protein n=1 Tax=unclassified Bradyrhizobium TaxID=2631580 RepID=UPI0015C9C4B5|nr:tetratricopeptide (TPR) repeat protein [Bradyrhizobium sp. CIR3A]MBB4392450.1 tetratricopeptide (TPR) repeat protein [Bradyrhizobium sp. ERR14]NYG48211.1 tetratricopeptide (TPR) repeat protein [Bradyrhizobium sp. IAR9]
MVQGIAEFERALALDCNLAEAQIGGAKLYMGRRAETEAHFKEAFRLSPRYIFAHSWFMVPLTDGRRSLFQGGRQRRLFLWRRAILQGSVVVGLRAMMFD